MQCCNRIHCNAYMQARACDLSRPYAKLYEAAHSVLGVGGMLESIAESVPRMLRTLLGVLGVGQRLFVDKTLVSTS